MTAAKYHSSAPDRWVMPRPTRDPMGNKYAPLQPMPEPPRKGWLAKIKERLA